NGQSVERRSYASRELGFEIRMEVVVGEMGEIRAFRTQLLRHGDGFGNAQMRRMVGPEQRVQHKHLGTCEYRLRTRRNVFRISHVTERTNAIPKHIDTPMR